MIMPDLVSILWWCGPTPISAAVSQALELPQKIFDQRDANQSICIPSTHNGSHKSIENWYEVRPDCQ